MSDFKYKVCVKCFTYNQAPYITDTLNGFVIQELPFPTVAVVVDDASTDGNDDIIRQFFDENFNKEDSSIAYERETEYANICFAQHKIKKNLFFAVLYLKYNHYSIKKNKLCYLKQWLDNAKYQALCEGDDYWIDPLKLQKQVSILDSDERIGLCYTDAKVYLQSRKLMVPSGDTRYRGLRAMLYSNPVMTLTTLYKADLFAQYWDEVRPYEKNWKMGDYPLWLWLAKHSEVRYLDEVTSVYRVLENSASHSKDVKVQVSRYLSDQDVQLFFCNLYLPDDTELKEMIEDKTNRRISNEFLMAKDRKSFLKNNELIHHKTLSEQVEGLVYQFPLAFYIKISIQSLKSFIKKILK